MYNNKSIFPLMTTYKAPRTPIIDWGHYQQSTRNRYFGHLICARNQLRDSYIPHCGKIFEKNRVPEWWVPPCTKQEGDPFAQPVIVYNSITNGYGILGAYNETTITVD